MAVVAQAQADAAAPSVLHRLFERVVSGRPLTAADFRAAAGAFVNEVLEDYPELRDLRMPPRVSQPAPGPRQRAPRKPAPVDMQVIHARALLGFAPNEALSEERIRDVRRQLAKRYHPDHGGSARQMTDVNQAAEILIASLRPPVVG